MDNSNGPSHSPDPASSSFPQNPEDFDADPRISFSKLSNKFILEADDGQEFEFDDALKRWVPAVRPLPARPRVFSFLSIRPNPTGWAVVLSNA